MNKPTLNNTSFKDVYETAKKKAKAIETHSSVLNDFVFFLKKYKKLIVGTLFVISIIISISILLPVVSRERLDLSEYGHISGDNTSVNINNTK